jgi:hypothetical protein
MTKDFIPYEQALVLKELGFDEPCLIKDTEQGEECAVYYVHQNGIPTFSQVFRWFREKYEYNSFIRGRKSMGFDYTLSDVPTNLSKRDTFQSPHVYQTYEEAELACLIKLIEIVKNGK